MDLERLKSHSPSERRLVRRSVPPEALVIL
jgi:hypothetical protein